MGRRVAILLRAAGALLAAVAAAVAQVQHLVEKDANAAGIAQVKAKALLGAEASEMLGRDVRVAAQCWIEDGRAKMRLEKR